MFLLGSAVSGFTQQPQPVPPKPTTPAVIPAASEGGPHELTRADLEAFLDGFVPYALKNGDVAGMTISVVKDGQVLLKKGYGYADVKAKKPMDPEVSMVRPGSTSKLFTWTAVMQLVEQGKLDLDRDVNSYLDFKIQNPYPKPITLRNLMTHRAGFEEGLKSVLMYDPKQFITNEQYLKNHQRPVMYPPGEVPAYSNYGAALAGYIVQRVSGEPFDDYVEQHIFAPLGMNHSTFRQPVPERFKADLAQGYRTASEPPTPFEGVITAPAGSMSSTADDMSRFMIAYLQGGQYQGHQILKPETVRQMWEPAVPQLDDLNVMGLGFFEENRNGRQIRGHGGDTIVFHTSLDLFINEGVGIFFSFNSRGENSAVYAMREALFNGFADRYFPPRGNPASAAQAEYLMTTSLSPSHARMIAGRYQSSRRIDSAFLKVLYLLSQTVITANDDGTINVPTFPDSKPKRYREVAPFLWAEIDGQHKVALTGVGEKRTIYSSDDPSSVLQPASFWSSAPLNLTVLGVSVLLLLIVVVGWPLSAYLRRKYGQPRITGKSLRSLRVLRIASVFDLLYLFGWIVALSPVLKNDLAIYNDAFDPYLRILQIAGLVVIAAAVAGIWAAAQKADGWKSTLWHGIVACALVGIVWLGFVGKLISFNLNY